MLASHALRLMRYAHRQALWSSMMEEIQLFKVLWYLHGLLLCALVQNLECPSLKAYLYCNVDEINRPATQLLNLKQVHAVWVQELPGFQ